MQQQWNQCQYNNICGTWMKRKISLKVARIVANNVNILNNNENNINYPLVRPISNINIPIRNNNNRNPYSIMLQNRNNNISNQVNPDLRVNNNNVRYRSSQVVNRNPYANPYRR